MYKRKADAQRDDPIVPLVGRQPPIASTLSRPHFESLERRTLCAANAVGAFPSSTSANSALMVPAAYLSAKVSVHLPAKLISGDPTHGSATVAIANSGSVRLSGSVAVELTASSVDSELGTPVASCLRSLSIGPRRISNVILQLTSLPILTAGDYFFVARVVGPDGNISISSSAHAVSIAAPVVLLQPAFLYKRPESVIQSATIRTGVLGIKNDGNVNFTGQVLVQYLANESDVSQLPNTIIWSEAILLRVRQGRSAIIKISLTDSMITAAGEGVLVRVTDPEGNTQTAYGFLVSYLLG